MRQTAAFILLIILMAVLPLAGQAQPPQDPTPAAQQAPIVLAPELFDSSAAALEAGDFERVVLDTSLFLLLNPTYSQAYYLRALGHYGQENTDLAMGDIEQALATAQDFPEYQAALYALRADIHAQSDALDEAADDYTLAIELNPSPELYTSRALLYITLEDLDKALTDLNSAVRESGDNPLLRLYRAYVNTQLGNAEDAAPDYYEFMQLIETRRIENDALSAGQTEFVNITEGVIHQFEIEGERNQVISILAQGRPGDSVDPLLVLLDEDGEVLAANDDTGGTTSAAILDFTLPATSTYTVLLSHSLGGFEGQVGIVFEVSK